MTLRYRACGVVGIAMLAVTACGSHADADKGAPDYTNIMAFDTATIRAVGRDTARLTVQLAESEAQQTMGLMERRTLAPDAGMLFLYGSTQPDSNAFWMFRTRIPLDIAFIDSAGTIRTVLTMQPCASDLASGCPSYPATTPYRAALEVNAGYFARQRLGVGDRVLLGDTTTRRRAKPSS
jgi:uncharacterized membrane protein (UPF0127 family)